MEKCRILVTVPACLEILLLSPSSQERVRNIRYVILDEVSRAGICTHKARPPPGTPLQAPPLGQLCPSFSRCLVPRMGCRSFQNTMFSILH